MKPILILILLFTLFVPGGSSCSKEKTDSQKIELKITYLNSIGECYKFTDSHRGYVINDSISFQSIGDSAKVAWPTLCDSAKLPKIDFSKYSLLGKLTITSPCDKINREVLLDSINKKYVFNINIQHTQESCIYIAVPNMNWVLVPKLPIKYAVEFNVNDPN
jgi:hypothetical protein